MSPGIWISGEGSFPALKLIARVSGISHKTDTWLMYSYATLWHPRYSVRSKNEADRPTAVFYKDNVSRLSDRLVGSACSGCKTIAVSLQKRSPWQCYMSPSLMYTRRWANIGQTLGRCVVFAGYSVMFAEAAISKLCGYWQIFAHQMTRRHVLLLVSGRSPPPHTQVIIHGLSWSVAQKTPHVQPMLVWYWAGVADIKPALFQRLVFAG